MNTTLTGLEISQARTLERYYRYHAQIYDLTRWAFLFGRRRLVRKLPSLPKQPHILEVGCGTGQNLLQLARKYPDAQITGIDASPSMLRVARRKSVGNDRIRLKQRRYGTGHRIRESRYDLVVMSYSLTMMDGNTEGPLQQARRELKAGGYIAAVDFHTTDFSWFRRWMHANHVIMEGRVLPGLQTGYTPVLEEVRQAYLKWWQYFLFVGQKS